MQVYSCSWSPDGTKVVSCSDDNTMRVWDVSLGECICTFTGHTGSVSDDLFERVWMQYFGSFSVRGVGLCDLVELSLNA
jgi:WD40 repeat protein